MSHEFFVLMAAAVSLGVVHTLLGPDHYLPFVAIGRARRWSFKKTAFVTVICGIGHILGAFLLGVFGIALGLQIGKLEMIEGMRGNLAAWVFIAFGLIYFVWGMRFAWKRRHPDARFENLRNSGSISRNDAAPWVLFVIFVLGPCEPLIPLILYAGAQGGMHALIGVTLMFGASTLLTMLVAVLSLSFGFRLISTRLFGSFGHVLAGVAILFCGLAIQFLNW